MDVYQLVTDRIISELEKGTVPWLRPWCSVREGAYNRITGRSYSLLNQLMLMHSGEYATFSQWSKLGGKIRKGEKSEHIVFWKWPEEEKTEEKDKDRETAKLKPILKYYSVYHVSQVEGVKPLETALPQVNAEGTGAADKLLRDYTAAEDISLECEYTSRAFYSPATDTIHIPKMDQFRDTDEYYSTAYHEAIHSTGNKKRLNRIGLQNVRFGSENYSKEELVAEIGSAFLCHHFGMGTDRSLANSAAYIGGWLKELNDDRRLIVMAAGQAEKAARYILQYSSEKE